MNHDDGPDLAPAAWRPRLSAALKHHWLGSPLPDEPPGALRKANLCDFDQTCVHCGLRRLRGSAEHSHRWQYKRPEWPLWREADDICLQRPGAPAKLYERARLTLMRKERVRLGRYPRWRR